MIKKVVAFCFFLFIFISFFSISNAANQNFKIVQAGSGVKEYLPGDFIHVIIEAPFDIQQIVADMPDNTQVNLVHERQTNVWHGLWQVPIGFKKGTYYAKLTAVDLEGNTFEQQTNAFFIGELTFITLIKKQSTSESALQGELAKKESIEARILALEAEEKAKHAQEMLGIGVESPVEKPVQPVKVVKKEIVAKVPQIKKQKKKKPKIAAMKEKEGQRLKQARLATVARFYIEKLDYRKAEGQVKELLKIDPKNESMNLMLNRIQKIRKAKGIKP